MQYIKTDGSMPHTKTTDAKHTLLEGIVKGIPRGTQRAVVDGIVSGIHRKADCDVAVETISVKPSATPLARGDFGAGTFGQSASRNILKSAIRPATAVAPKKPARKSKKALAEATDKHETQLTGFM